MESFEQVFKAVLDYCSGGQISATSYDAFIKTLKPESITGDSVVLSAQNDFIGKIAKERFGSILEEAFLQVLGFEVRVDIVSRNALSAAANSPIKNPYIASGVTGDRSYTFDTFVVGSGNRFAHAAALAVASNPAGAYNPLFIYGGSGLGKTHLMMAIKNDLAKTRPQFNVKYISCEQFTNDLIEAIRLGTTEDFREKYRSIDVLLVDDIQFIGGKESTQEEFFHTFNTLYQDGKQIVLASDRPPKEIRSLTERLRTRFESGLLADIIPPEYETRVSILKRKAELLGYPLPDDVAQFIADNLKDNIRQLEGIVKKLYAYRLMDNVPPTVANAQAAIKDIMQEQRPLPVTVDKIVEEVSRTFGISVEDIRSKKRDEEIANARQVAMYCMREVTSMTMEQIGAEFGGRNHSTVTHSIKKVSEQLKKDQNLKDMVEDIIKNSKS